MYFIDKRAVSKFYSSPIHKVFQEVNYDCELPCSPKRLLEDLLECLLGESYKQVLQCALHERINSRPRVRTYDL